MTAQPQLHFSVFVGGVVVHNHVDLFLRRVDMVDHAEELQPFLMTVPVVAHGDHLTVESVQRGEQRSRPVAFVIVSHCSAAAFLQRQTRLCPVQGLNLTLFISAQHDGALGWIQYRPTMIFQFFGEADIPAELERPDQMRLETMGVPDAPHAGLADACCCGHRTRAPVRGIGRLVANRHVYHALHLVVGNRARPARTRGVFLAMRRFHHRAIGYANAPPSPE